MTGGEIMKTIIKKGLTLIAIASLMAIPIVSTNQTQAGEDTEGKKEMSDEAERAQRSAEVLKAMVESGDSGIPKELLQRAHAIAVIPHVVKGALGVGGSFGKGLVAQRVDADAWSAPVYVDIGGASYGFQVGVEATDLVLVFLEAKGLNALLEDKLKLGASASIAAGPIGRNASIGTNVTLDSAIYSYSRTKGIFAGVSLEGAVIAVDNSANDAVYGEDSDALAILNTQKANKQTKPFMSALKDHVPERDKS
jgi:lipid-binding SYLF domain-containing protein